MLDRPGRGLADGRRDLGGTPLGQHHTGSAGALGRAADRAEVLRILNLIQRDDQRLVACEQFLGLDVAELRHLGADALMPVGA